MPTDCLNDQHVRHDDSTDRMLQGSERGWICAECHRWLSEAERKAWVRE